MASTEFQEGEFCKMGYESAKMASQKLGEFFSSLFAIKDSIGE